MTEAHILSTAPDDLLERLRNPNYAKSATFAASYMNEAAAAIDELRLQHQWACQEIDVAIAERNQAKAAAHDAIKAALASMDADDVNIRKHHRIAISECHKWIAAYVEARR